MKKRIFLLDYCHFLHGVGVNRFSIIRTMSILAVWLIAVNAGELRAEEEEDEDFNKGALRLESKTKHNSADYELGKVQDQDQDYKRTEVGAGEKIDLILKGKRKFIGENENEISWEIEEGQECAEFEEEPSGKRVATLVIKKKLPAAEGTVKVCVNTGGQEESVSSTFTAIRPASITGKNLKEPHNTIDGDTATFGASTLLEMTIHPTNVSFKNIEIKEEDEEEEENVQNVEGRPSLWEPHITAEFAAPVSKTNTFKDQISAGRRPLSMLDEQENGRPKHILPQQFTWKCALYLDAGFDGNVYKIDRTDQVFTFEQIGQNSNRKDVAVTISKFGCSVKRTTLAGNTHQYN